MTCIMALFLPASNPPFLSRMTQKHILLLSAYDTPSHVYWREGLVEHFPEHDWQVLTLPPRYFSWRIRGNSLSWAFGKEKELLTREYDLVIATSMTDLSALRGFLPHLGNIPTVVYYHENQFVYPANGSQPDGSKHSLVDPQLTSIYTALCADKVVFNSRFNQQTFCEGARELMKKMPDCVPKNIVGVIESKASVIPVPLLLAPSKEACHSLRAKNKDFTVLWNHRWEYDKGPDRLLLAVQAVVDKNLPIRFNIVGQGFRKEPVEFKRIRTLLLESGLLSTWGYQNREDYAACLQSSHVVLSTAVHDFQGLAVMEAVAAGCVPLVPERLAYKEYYPKAYGYESNIANLGIEVKSLLDKLESFYHQWKEGEGLVVREESEIDLPFWSNQKRVYQRLIDDLE